MKKWVQFYHMFPRFDYNNMRYTDELHLVPMLGSDGIVRIDGRFGMYGVRAKIRQKIDSMKEIKGFAPCAFSVLSGESLLDARESDIYQL